MHAAAPTASPFDVDIKNMPLPSLRNDLDIYEGPADSDGTPSWTLHDPASNRFFRLGWAEFECLARFPVNTTIGALAKSIEKETTLSITPEEIKQLCEFLMKNELIRVQNEAILERFLQKRQAKEKPLWSRIVHGYLSVIVPLVRPDRFLQNTYKYVVPLFTRQFFMLVLTTLLLGITLTLQRWDEFTHTFMQFFTWDSLIFYALAIIFVKICHELSHAYMATKYGVRVSSMGVAFIVMYPVLFTETTGAWKLADHKKRRMIGFAGIMAELTLAAIALITWNIFPEGTINSIAFFIATVSLIGSLLINLNPLMRFDGYYLLADTLALDNLQERCFALGRWHMRKTLFGWPDHKPEDFTPAKQRFLIGYAYAIWLYRFFLFMGIAILVYHLFFKPLGPILMAIEIIWFIALPIWREIKVWIKEKEKMQWNTQTKRLSLTLAILTFLFIVPWNTRIDVPAIIQPTNYEHIYSPRTAEIMEVLVKNGENVTKDQPLLRLSSQELEQQIILARKKLQALEQQRARESTNRELIQGTSILQQQIAQAQTTLDSLLQQQGQLTVTAPFDGQIVSLGKDLHTGRIIAPNTALLHIATPESHTLYGYIHENDIHRIKENATGTFFAETHIGKKIPVKIKTLSKTDAAELEWPSLSSRFGGPIAIEQQSTDKLIPHGSIYAMTFTTDTADNTSATIPIQMRGTVKLSAPPQSIAYYVMQNTLALLVRESGF